MKRVSCLIALLLAGVVGTAEYKDGSKADGSADSFRFDARDLTNTSLWTKVNATPFSISSQLDVLCAAPPTMRDYQTERKTNPHAATTITVYVNPIGRTAMFTKDSPAFPQGSVIIKQKNGRFAESNTTLLYTVMRKREPGYNPAVGDWEFSVVNANGSTIEASGKLDNCQGCHVKKPDSNFVFRPYVEFR